MATFTAHYQTITHLKNIIKKGFISLFAMCFLNGMVPMSAQDIGTWQVVTANGAAPEARHESGFVEANGKFYLLGGRSTRKIQVFDPTTQQWSNTQTTTGNLNHFQAVTYNNKIYIIGAFTGNYPNESPVATVKIYDPATDQLTDGPLIPENRRRGSTGAVVYNNKIYIVGGNRNGHSAFLADGVTPANVAWLDEFDPATGSWQTLPDAPRARDHFAATVIDNKLYIAGGRRSRFGTTFGTFKDTEAAVDVYDFSTRQWLSGSNLPANIPTPRAGASAAALGNEILVLGGEIDYNPPTNLALKTTEALNTTTGTWRALSPLNLGRHATQAIVQDNQIYLAGGSRTKGGTEITADQTFMEVFAFNETTPDRPAFPEWTNVGNAPRPRVEAPAVVYQGEFYIFNGFQFSYDIENSNVKYNPQTNTWTPLATMPSQPNGKPWAVTHNGIALVGDTVWIVGGRVGNVPGPPTDRVWWYKISTDTWLEGPILPFKSAGGGVGRVGRKLYYIGGLDNEARCDYEFHLVYDLDNPDDGWQDSTTTVGFPEYRNHFGMTVLEGKIYIIGGQHGHDGCQQGTDVKLVHRYDPIANTWTRLNDLPFEESHAEPGTFAIDGKIYKVGGQLRGRHVRVYDPATDTWTRVRELDLPEALMSPISRIMGDTLFSLLGGAPGTSNPVPYTFLRTIERTPLLELGFNPPQLNVQMNQGEIKFIETILYSQAGIANYTLSGDLPNWLSANKNGGSVEHSDEEITLQFNTANLAPGTYTYQLVASAPGYTSGTIEITLQVDGTSGTPQDYWLEAECGTVGSTWSIYTDPLASDERYVIIKRKGVNSLSVPPANIPDNKVVFNVEITQAGAFRFWARVKAPNTNDDSFWVRINGGNWISWSDGMQTTSTFDWREVPGSPFNLIAGNNVIEIAYRENGTGLDKIYLSSSGTPPNGFGESASNCSDNATPTDRVDTLLNLRKKDIRIFPNPSGGIVQLQANFLNNQRPFQVEVIDLLGKTVQVYEWEDGDPRATYLLSTNQLAPGTYLVRVVQGSQQQTGKLMIE